MMAWLKHCPDGFTTQDHIYSYVPSEAERVAERHIIESPECCPELKLLSQQERKVRDGERSEPEFVP